MGNKPSTKIIPSTEKLIKVKVQGNSKRYVVVFDIDNTLSKSKTYLMETDTETASAAIKKLHQECPIIDYKHKGYEVYRHVFLPYLHILFGYLLDQGVRIVFFSATFKERNISVIPELLTSFWGKEKYEALKSEGQFDIFSKGDLRAGHLRDREGYSIKDLKVVVQDTESLLDCILVEDARWLIAYDQKPCLFIIDLLFWDLPDKNEEKGRGNYCKNNIYYMLGLFKTYFEEEECKKFPLRVGLDQILPIGIREFIEFFVENNEFVEKMMHLGLKEVQKIVPGAILYNVDKKDLFKMISSDLREKPGDKVSKETKYESFVRNLRIANIPLSMYYLATHLFEKFKSSQITGVLKSAEFYQKSIVNLIDNLKDTAGNDKVEVGPNIYDASIILIDTSTRPRKDCIMLSFIYVPSEEELEKSAKVTLQNIQPQVDIKRSCYNEIISVGIAYSANSLLAAYNDHYEEHKQIYLTDIYVT